MGTGAKKTLQKRQVETVSSEKASKIQPLSGNSPKRGKGQKREASSFDTLTEQEMEKKMAQLDKKEKAADSASGENHITKKIKLAKKFKTMTISPSGNESIRQSLTRLAESMKRSGESRSCVMLQRELLFTLEQRRQLAGIQVDLPFRRRQRETLSPAQSIKRNCPSVNSAKFGRGLKQEASSMDKLVEQLRKNKMAHRDKGQKSAALADDHIAKKIKLAQQFKVMTVSLSGNKLLAARIVPEFKIFLSNAENQEVETLH